MKPKVVVGLGPEKIPELRTALEAQGWNVVDGAPVPDAVDKTVFLTDTVPAVVDDYEVLSVGLNISQNQGVPAIVDMVSATSADAVPDEPVIIQPDEGGAADTDSAVPQTSGAILMTDPIEKEPVTEAPESSPEEEAEAQRAKDERKAERNDRRMAFLLS